MVCLRYARGLLHVATLLEGGLMVDKSIEWSDSLNADKVSTAADFGLEIASALYTVGCTEAALGRKAAERDQDLSAACRHFSAAGGYYKAITDKSYRGAPGTDLSVDACRALEAAMVTNAQITVYRQAQIRGVGPEACATIGMGVCQRLEELLRILESGALRDTGVHAFFSPPTRVLTGYYKADALAMRASGGSSVPMGEKLKRIYDAQTLCYDLKQELSSILRAYEPRFTKSVTQAVHELDVTLLEKRQETEEENKAIYHEVMLTNPPPIQPRSNCKALDVSDELGGEVDKSITSVFGAPVPKELRGALQAYGEEVAKLVSRECSLLHDTSAGLSKSLVAVRTASESMTASDAENASNEAVSDQASVKVVREAVARGGWSMLEELRKEIHSMSAECRTRINRARDVLQKEEAEDSRLCQDARMYQRLRSHQINPVYHDAIHRVENELSTAAKSDAYVESLMFQAKERITSMPSLEEIDGKVARRDTSELLQRIRQMKKLNQEGEALLRKRDNLIQAFHEKQGTSRITAEEMPKDFEQVQGFIAKGLKSSFGELQTEAVKLRQQIQTFEGTVQGELRQLEPPEEQKKFNRVSDSKGAAEKWRELLGFLQEGKNFYLKELEIISQITRDLNVFADSRSREAENILGPDFARLTISDPYSRQW